MNVFAIFFFNPALLFGQGAPAQVAAPAAAPPPAASPAAPAAPAPESFQGRGVHYVDAATACPAVPIGTRSEHACLRIGLDDENSSVVLDRAKHRLVFRNAASYPKDSIVGDVVLPGWIESEKGRAPTAVHLAVWKKGDKFHTKLYSHPVVREKPTKAEIEQLEVVVTDGKTDTVVVTDELAQKAVLDPGLAARLAGFLTEVTDNLGNAPAKDGDPKPVGDITISIGLGPAAKKVQRLRLFHEGADWELRLEAFSSLVPKFAVRRDLFLYGLEGAPAVAEIKKRGLKKGDTLSLAVRDGKGSVRFGREVSDLPDAANSIHDFLETAFVGSVVAHQAHLGAPN